MCGIIGFITENPQDSNRLRCDYMTQGLYVDALRGQDATGIFSVKKDKRAYFMKDATDARLFLQQRQFIDCIDDFRVNRYLAVGHNRKATTGGHTYENAHPFISPNICLVHNGTLREYYELPTHKVGTSDSARVCAALSEADPGGIEVLEKLKGDFAFVWYDARNTTLYLTTNGNRPLSYLRAGDHTFFASEGMMAKFILSRVMAGKLPRISHFKPYTLYSAAMGEVLFNTVEYNEAKARVYPATTRTYSGGTDAGRQSQIRIHEAMQEAASRVDTTGRITHNPGLNHKGGVIPRKEIVNTLKFPNEGTKAARRRLTKVNQLLRGNDIDMVVGDLLEINRETSRTYETEGNKASREPLGEVTGFMSWVLEGNETIFLAAVHGCPMIDVYSDMVDTVKGRLFGAYLDEHGDMTLVLRYTGPGAYRRPVATTIKENLWPPFIRTFFSNQRHHYNTHDKPQHEWLDSTCLLTNRETDMLLVDEKCGICNVSARMVNYGDTLFIAERQFVCLDCNKKGVSVATYDEKGHRSVSKEEAVAVLRASPGARKDSAKRSDGKVWDPMTGTWNAVGKPAKPHIVLASGSTTEPNLRLAKGSTTEAGTSLKEKAVASFNGRSSSGVLTLSGRTKPH